jgi:hypothetical protein
VSIILRRWLNLHDFSDDRKIYQMYEQTLLEERIHKLEEMNRSLVRIIDQKNGDIEKRDEALIAWCRFGLAYLENWQKTIRTKARKNACNKTLDAWEPTSEARPPQG